MTAVVYLLKEGGAHCKTFNDLVRSQVPPEWGGGLPSIHQWSGELLRGWPIQGQEGSGVESREPCLLQAIQAVGYPSSGSICEQTSIQGTPIPQPRPLGQESIQGRCVEEVARGAMVSLSTTNIIQLVRSRWGWIWSCSHLTDQIRANWQI